MANLIPEIAKMLGLKLGEEFKIDTSGDDIFKITESGVWMRKSIDKEEWLEKPFEFVMLCNGDAEIIRLPWEPKEGESFYTFTAAYGEWSVSLDVWAEEPCNYALLDKGWIYRTEKEAKAALPAVLKELKKRKSWEA